MSRWLHIIGIGEDGLDGLSAGARAQLEEAEVIFGGRRHLAFLADDDPRERRAWPSPFDALIGQLRELKGRRVCVLASGDPLSFGVGRQLVAAFAADDIQVWPHLSAYGCDSRLSRPRGRRCVLLVLLFRGSDPFCCRGHI